MPWWFDVILYASFGLCLAGLIAFIVFLVVMFRQLGKDQ